MVKTFKIANGLSFVDIAPPIPGFEKFISTYVLSAGKVALTDVGPSTSVDNLLSGLAELNVNPADISYILATHVHIDHTGGVGQIIKQMPSASVVVHERGARHLIDPTRLWEDSQRALGQRALEYGPIEPVPEDRIIIGKDGMLVSLGETEIEVLETPGHSPHHLTFLDRKERRLFVGDVAGVYVGGVDLIRPATPVPFSLEKIIASLDRLIGLNPMSLCYIHYGVATDALGKLHRFREQLLLWGNIIADCLEKGIGHQDIYDRIRQKDTLLAGIDNLPPDQRDRELYFIDNSIKGYVSYFEKFGTEYIRKHSQS